MLNILCMFRLYFEQPDWGEIADRKCNSGDGKKKLKISEL